MKREGRYLFLYLVLTGMELSWLYLTTTMLSRLTGERFSAFTLLAVYLAAFSFNKLLNRLRWRKRYVFIINALLFLMTVQLALKPRLYAGVGLQDWLLALPRAFASLGITFKPEMTILIASLPLWGLGLRLSRVRVSFGVLIADFQFGLALLLIAFFISSQVAVVLPGATMLAVTFITLSLLGLGVAHAEAGVSWLGEKSRGFWLGLLLLTIVVVLVLGLVITLLVTPDLIELVLSPIRWLIRTIDRMGVALADFLDSHLNSGGLLPDVVAVTPEPEPEAPDVWELFGWPIRLRDILRFIFGLFWLTLIFVGIWQACSWLISVLSRRLALGSGAEVEHLNGAFGQDFLGFLRSLWHKLFALGRLFRRKKASLSGIPEIDAVRGVYRELLFWAAGRGLARRSFETPWEYLYALEGALPLGQSELRFITSLYVSARYGLVFPQEPELAELRKTWQNLRKMPFKVGSMPSSGKGNSHQKGDGA